MPTIFVSYSRGTASVPQLVQKLREHKFNVWFDKNDMHLGTPDWRKDVENAINCSDAIILCLTRKACTSDNVKYEIQIAKESNRIIFPIVFEQMDDVQSCIRSIGLPENSHFDLTFVQHIDDPWAVGVETIVRDLDHHGIKVTKYPVKTEDFKANFSSYLKNARKKISHLNLSQLLRLYKEDAHIREIYFPVPTNLNLSVDISNYKVVDWWVGHRTDVLNQESKDWGEVNNWKGLDSAVLDGLAGQIQMIIDEEVFSPFLDETTIPLIAAPYWRDGIKESILPLSLIDVAAMHDRIVLIGDPGSGKSTSVKYLAFRLINQILDGSNSDRDAHDDFSVWPHGALLPIYISFRELVRDSFPDLDQPADIDYLESHITRYLVGGDNKEEVANNIMRTMRDGSAILILDGLDEVPIPQSGLEQRRAQVKNFIESLDSELRCRIIITSRPYAYSQDKWQLSGFQAVNIDKLSNIHKSKIVYNLFYRSLKNKDEAEKRSMLLLQQIRDHGVPEKLTSTPLLLTLLTGLSIQGGEFSLPVKRGELYHKCITLLIDSWARPRVRENKSLQDALGFNSINIYRVLQRLAFNAHMQGHEQIKRKDLLDELYTFNPLGKFMDALEYLSDHSGILSELDSDTFCFAHRSFQEVLASAYMIASSSGNYSSIRHIFEEDPITWRIPCLLIGDLLSSELKVSDEVILPARPNELWVLLNDLCDEDVTGQTESKDPRWWSIWLAAKILYEQEMYIDIQNQRSIWKNVFENLRAWIKELLNHTDALPPPERIEAARILGIMLDDRKGVGNRHNCPDIYWCRIPGGSFSMGTTEEDKKEIQNNEWAHGQPFEREVSGGPITVEEFYISKYPITVQQFELFANDPEGYNNSDCWSPAGRDWRERTGPDAPKDLGRWNIPNIPRIYVNWYEASAFCNWLTRKTGYKVRLPSESEWEKAARGLDGRFFPWGNTFDEYRSNTNLNKVEGPNPPGCFLLPDGYWEDNPLDMSGNVWEWCSTIYKSEDKIFNYPYNSHDGREDLYAADNCRMITRGGSHVNGVFLSRVTYRGQDAPYARFDRQGFRVATSDPKCQE